MTIRILATSLVFAASVAGAALAQNYAALSRQAAQGISYAQARAALPNLSEVIFDKADRNGDGLVDSKELPTLEAVYQAAYLDR